MTADGMSRPVSTVMAAQQMRKSEASDFSAGFRLILRSRFLRTRYAGSGKSSAISAAVTKCCMRGVGNLKRKRTAGRSTQARPVQMAQITATGFLIL